MPFQALQEWGLSYFPRQPLSTLDSTFDESSFSKIRSKYLYLMQREVIFLVLIACFLVSLDKWDVQTCPLLAKDFVNSSCLRNHSGPQVLKIKSIYKMNSLLNKQEIMDERSRSYLLLSIKLKGTRSRLNHNKQCTT